MLRKYRMKAAVTAAVILALARVCQGQPMAAVSSGHLYIVNGVDVAAVGLAFVTGAGFHPLGDAVAFNAAGDLFVATEAGLFRTTLGSGVFTNTGVLGPMSDGSRLGLRDLAISPAGMIAAINSATLYVVDGQDVLEFDLKVITGAGFHPLGDAVAFDAAGDLFVATEAGLFRTTPGSGVFTNTGVLGPMSDGSLLGLRDLAISPAGMIAAINSATLYVVDGQDVLEFDLKAITGAGFHPLGDAVAFDAAGDLFVATEAGLFRTTPGSGVFTNTGVLGPMSDGTLLGLRDLAVSHVVPEPYPALALFFWTAGALAARRNGMPRP